MALPPSMTNSRGCSSRLPGGGHYVGRQSCTIVCALLGLAEQRHEVRCRNKQQQAAHHSPAKKLQVKEVLQHQVKRETAQENRETEFLHPDCGPQPELNENCAPSGEPNPKGAG